MHFPPHGDEFRREGVHLATLKVKARKNPSMSVQITPGSLWIGDKLVEFSGGYSANLTQPSSASKICLICIDYNSIIRVVDGVASSSPVSPLLPRGCFPLAVVKVENTTTHITQDMIYDVTGIFLSSAFDHADLKGRNRPDSHTIDAITGLRDELDSFTDISSISGMLSNYANKTGTSESTFVLNQDHSGTPTQNCSLKVERGSSPDVFIRWNENDELWQYTNNGSDWINLPDSGVTVSLPVATDSILGGVKIGSNINVDEYGVISVSSGITEENFTTELMNKLNGIEDGANNYIHPSDHPASMIVEDTNNQFITSVQKLKLDNIESNANNYIHPADHPASMIVEDSTHRFVTDVEKSTWDSKLDDPGYTPENSANKGVANGYPALDSSGKIPLVQLPDSVNSSKVVADIGSRNALTAYEGLKVHVIDATLDPTVDNGSAGYIYDGSSWIKTYESEGLDTSLNWADIIDKPAEFPPADHNHDSLYAPIVHNHTGMYEPVDATILREADLTGTGSATTPARSDHDHDSTYEPVDATLLREADLTGTGSATTPARSDHDHGASTAGNSKYFGTDVAGSVGFYDLPSGSGSVDAIQGILFVAKNGNDSTGNGSADLPFLTVGAAITALGSTRGKIIVSSGNYAEDIVLPDMVSLFGCGAGETTIDGSLTTGSVTHSLGHFQVTGNLIINGNCNINNVYARSTVTANADVQSFNFTIEDDSTGPALTVTSGLVTFVTSSISTTADNNAIVQNGGKLSIISGQVSNNSATNPAIVSTAGQVILTTSSVINSGGGLAANIENGATTEPNAFNTVLTAGDIVCGMAQTVVEGIIGGSISGSAIIKHSHDDATTSASGFMSASDKNKLDSVEAPFNPQITKTIYVDSLRSDSYTPTGSVLKPFKNTTSALDSLIGPALVVLAPGSYNDDIALPNNVSLVGSGVDKTIINANLTTGTNTLTMKDFSTSGAININGNSYIDNIKCTGNVSVSADLKAANFDIISTSGTAMSISSGTINLTNGNLQSTGTTSTITHNGGSLRLSEITLIGDSSGASILNSSNGQCFINDCHFNNTVSGPCIDVDNGALVDAPNIIDGVIVNGNIICGAAYTFIDGTYGAEPTGSNILYKTANNVEYTPATSTDWNTVPSDVKAALDELASRLKTLEP